MITFTKHLEMRENAVWVKGKSEEKKKFSITRKKIKIWSIHIGNEFF